MLPYWLLFLIPAIGVVSPRQLHPASRPVMWVLIGVFFTLVIGLRFQVGGDWWNYLGNLSRMGSLPFGEVLRGEDPGYYLLNWLGMRWGGGIFLVNLVCGAITMAGIVAFCRRQPLPWLALLVAIPYLIIVVAMGYTRQAAALGFLLLGLVALGRERTLTFAFYVLLATLFHKSAVLMLPVAALAVSQQRLWSLFWLVVIGLIGGYLFLFDSADQLWTTYVEADMQSQGGLIRVLMNAVPAIIFLVLGRYFMVEKAEKRLWQWMAIFSVVCIPLVVLSSTATDRMALYLIPVQLYVFSRLPLIFSDRQWQAAIVLAIIGYYALAQFVWLTYSAHSTAWVPYRMVGI